MLLVHAFVLMAILQTNFDWRVKDGFQSFEVQPYLVVALRAEMES